MMSTYPHHGPSQYKVHVPEGFYSRLDLIALLQNVVTQEDQINQMIHNKNIEVLDIMKGEK